jgi:hypothetical protein
LLLGAGVGAAGSGVPGQRARGAAQGAGGVRGEQRGRAGGGRDDPGQSAGRPAAARGRRTAERLRLPRQDHQRTGADAHAGAGQGQVAALVVFQFPLVSPSLSCDSNCVHWMHLGKLNVAQVSS